jgi:hypothetical protein
MSNNKDYIPRSDRDFLTWSTSFLDNLSPLAASLNVPSAVVDTVSKQRTDFAAKYTIAENEATRTKVTVDEKNIARQTLVATIRQTVSEYLTHNHLMTDPIRNKLGLPIPDKHPTPSPVATTIPWIKVITSIIRELGFEFYGSETSKAKPEGQRGMELVSLISDTKPTEVDDLIHSAFSTHSPLVLKFKESERGKIFWFAVRWENTRGEKGPWSEITSIIIP